jgi:phi LC3 family holin
MKINWSKRIDNKATLSALIACIVTFVYQLLGIVDVATPISEDMVTQLVGVVLNILVAIGVIVDPNTKGVSDNIQSIEKDN